MQPKAVLIAFAAGLMPVATAQRDWTVICNANAKILQAPTEPVRQLIENIPNQVPYPLDGEDNGSGNTGAHSFFHNSRDGFCQVGVSADCMDCGYDAYGAEIADMARLGFEECVDSGLNDAGNGRFFNYRVENPYYQIQVGGGPPAGSNGVAGTTHIISI